MSNLNIVIPLFTSIYEMNLKTPAQIRAIIRLKPFDFETFFLFLCVSFRELLQEGQGCDSMVKGLRYARYA